MAQYEKKIESKLSKNETTLLEAGDSPETIPPKVGALGM